MTSDTNMEGNSIDTSELDDDILLGDEPGTLTLDFLEAMDHLILGHTNLDIHSLLQKVDIASLDKKSIRGLLIDAGNLAGKEGQRVALLHILVERGDLNVQMLNDLMYDENHIGRIDLTNSSSEEAENE